MQLPHWELANWNTLWASMLVDVCVEAGIHRVFVSPGYRNAPIISALIRRDELDVSSCFDERAAAFQALAWAKASGKPAVLVCTSGSALANYYPAIVEASCEQVPLLVVSADRPFELQHTAANQTMNQSDFFAKFASASYALPAASSDTKPAAVYAVLDLAMRSLFEAPFGVVQLNMAFRKPLEPKPVANTSEFESYLKEVAELKSRRERANMRYPSASRSVELSKARDFFSQYERPFVMIGRLDSQDNLLAQTLKTLEIPYYIDICSSLKGSDKRFVLPSVENIELRRFLIDYQADLVVHLGRRLVTQSFDRFFEENPPKSFLSVSETYHWQDPSHVSGLHWNVRPEDILSQFPQSWFIERPEKWKPELFSYIAPNQVFEARYVASSLCEQLPKNTPLVLGNSRAIRNFDSLGNELAGISIHHQRGLSGIEGGVAQLLGVASAKKAPSVLFTGDVSLMHDLNSLLLVKSFSLCVSIFVWNDGGGRIFNSLDVAQFPNLSTPWMTTPHEFEFEGIAKMAGLKYVLIKSLEAWQDFLTSYSPADTSILVELQSFTESQ